MRNLRGPSSPPTAQAVGRPPEVVAIGASTGGPNALGVLLPTLPPDLPVPVLIVQHMPPIFTKLLAERLCTKTLLRVREAASGDELLPGYAYIAPGNHHMIVCQDGSGQLRLQMHQEPHENSCRPSVDVLFRAVARVYGKRSLAVVLTGMGQDGLRGCSYIREAGGQILVQDEATSVVWGMPGMVANAGLADRVLPLQEIGAEILRLIYEGRGAPSRVALTQSQV